MRLGDWWVPLLRSRLLVLLPFSFCFLALVTGFLVLFSFRSRLSPGDTVDSLVWNQIVGAAGGTIIVCGVVSFGAGYLLALAIRHALRGLGDAVDQMGRGKLDVESRAGTGSEIEQLHSHFRRMAHAMNTLVQETGMGATVSVGMDGRVSMVNSLGQLMLGVEPGDALGKPLRALFDGQGHGCNAGIVRALETSLREQDPLAEREVEISLRGGRRSVVKMRTSFYTNEDRPQMAVVLLDKKLAETGDVRRQIERAARFLTLGSFATTLAHEIRNPLGSLAGLAELLMEEAPDEDLKLEFVSHIQQGTDRLNRLIDGLMDIASLENCNLTPESPKDIVNDAVGERRHVARSRDVELRVEFEDNLPLVNCSREWLARAVRNLVDNAIDETPPGGSVEIRVCRRRVTENIDAETAQRNYAEFSVRNTGSYIPEARRKKIFEPFETGKQTGMGLGLSIVQEIVQSHGGAVEVSSDPAQGTRFAFRIATVE